MPIIVTIQEQIEPTVFEAVGKFVGSGNGQAVEGEAKVHVKEVNGQAVLCLIPKKQSLIMGKQVTSYNMADPLPVDKLEPGKQLEFKDILFTLKV